MIPIPPTMLMRAGAALLLLAIIAGGVWRVYEAGRTSGLAEGDAKMQAAVAAAEAERGKILERAVSAERRMTEIEADAGRRVAQARRRGDAAVATLKDELRANPDFSALVRPAGVQRVRDEQLADIAAAADRAAGLSAGGAPGLQGAGDGADAGTL